MRVIGKFSETARSIGFANACLFALTRALGAVFGGRVRVVKYYFMAQPLHAPQGKRESTGSFDLAWAGPECALFSQVERPAATLASRFRQGARCLVASSKQGQLAGFLWFVIGPYEEDEVRARFVPMPSGAAAWDFDVTVMPRYRMGRLFSFLWAHASRELSAYAVAHSLSRISAFNGASLASHKRLGARRVGSATFLCIGAVQITTWLTQGRRRWHLGWDDRHRPAIAIRAD